MCAPAVLASPVIRKRVIYGLTDGSIDVTSLILTCLYPDSEILVLSGRSADGSALIDEPSVWGPTEWVYASGGHVRDAGCWTREAVNNGVDVQDYPGEITLAQLLYGEAPDCFLRLVAVEASIALASDLTEFPADLTREARQALGSSDFVKFLNNVRDAARNVMEHCDE